jgi:hypothetical protein
LLLQGPRTWTIGNISIIIIIAIGYGIWFNVLDSAIYCVPPNKPVPPEIRERLVNIDKQHCIEVGLVLGGNVKYQPWNIIGHCIPGLFLLLSDRNKVELFLAGVLISSTVMDSPLWGIMRLMHDGPLWHCKETENNRCTNFEDTYNMDKWIAFYYNPIGLYSVWNDNWHGQPTAAFIFWSLIARVVLAIVLIRWQRKQELKNINITLFRYMTRILRKDGINHS